MTRKETHSPFSEDYFALERVPTFVLVGTEQFEEDGFFVHRDDGASCFIARCADLTRLVHDVDGADDGEPDGDEEQLPVHVRDATHHLRETKEENEVSLSSLSVVLSQMQVYQQASLLEELTWTQV